MSSGPSIQLRSETKPFERRSALTPSTASTLVQKGWQVFVERDDERTEADGKRCFADEEFEKVGCTLVPSLSYPSAPSDRPILGLKELLPIPSPSSPTYPLPHSHITFAHCFKSQGGWTDVIGRWEKGGGVLYDLEFLADEKGRRVAAFGFWAGWVGAAVGLRALDAQLQSTSGRLGTLSAYDSEASFLVDARSSIQAAQKSLGRPVRALVIGALGRCGRGAVDCLKKAGVEQKDIIEWDMAETAKGGPFEEILDVDIFVNCIYLTTKIPNFVDRQFLSTPKGLARNLRVVVDVSCDTTNPNNPIPIYDINTHFGEPTVDVDGIEGPPLTVISIDHLPSLLPREASDSFSQDLLPSLLQLPEATTERVSRTDKRAVPQSNEGRVWKEAERLFWRKVDEAKEAVGSATN